MLNLRRESALLVGLLCGALTFSPVAAHAAGSPAPASAASAAPVRPSGAPAAAVGTPPDIVRLRDGGLLRGTIIELNPRDAVEIALPNGTTRKLPMNQVTYAGPVNGDPQDDEEDEEEEEDDGDEEQVAPPVRTPSQTVGRDDATVDVRSPRPGVTLHLRTMPRDNGSEARQIERRCTAPCSMELPRGTYYAGLSLGAGRILPAAPVYVSGPTLVTGHVVTRGGTRTIGVALLVAGGIVGTLMLSGGDDSGVLGGAFVVGLSQLLGWHMALKPDLAVLEAQRSSY